MKKLDNLICKLSETLRAKHLKIATAESCTGGMLAYLLTELSGSSEWFERGFVTYSNLAKQEMLGIKPELIKSHGAVSQEVAEAMALGALAHSAADFSLSVTGIAGPTGGSPQKPVGTVWIAWARANFLHTELCNFPNVSRQTVRQLTCIRALEGAIDVLNS